MSTTDDGRQPAVETTAKRHNTWPAPNPHDRQGKAGSNSLRIDGKASNGYFLGKTGGKSMRPFKATGHKGGISRQGSKRG